jgi:TRAP transporter 4TM/12TM fusion protein
VVVEFEGQGMSEEKKGDTDSGLQQAEDMVAQVETGGRSVVGPVGTLLAGVALLWSTFQLWYASPLPFMLGFGVLNDTEARAIHLAFAVFLTYTGFPALKRARRDRVPIYDWVAALVGAFCAGYLFLFYRELSDRPGLPTDFDLAVGVVGMILLLEATRRALGPPLMVVAAIFLIYTFAGPYMPEVIAHKGASLSKAMSHQWLSTEGVFGVALGVSASFVFLFVLFGALLDRAGAGYYFIMVAFSLMGHLRGGPAKAAVVSSAMTGLISGSSIANVVTTGTFTIPLMKRVGFSAEKAGAVEVASSTNGQLTPPIMGAAAFLMVEYVGVSLVDVMKHAFLPAIISYMALVYIVHLEAMKAKMVGLPRPAGSKWTRSLLSMLFTVLGLIIIGGVLYYGFGWAKGALGPSSAWLAVAVLGSAYVGLVWFGSRYPELDIESADQELLELPKPGPTIKSGLHYLLPVVVLMWFLIVERKSPGLSAFWATMLMVVIAVTQRPLFAFFRAKGDMGAATRRGFDDLIQGMIAGARNMIGIGVATAAAGIVVGTVTLTGIGLVMTEFVEFVSGGNLMLMLFFTAFICLVLGMGLPTTANYIVVSSLMAPVIVALGAQGGLIVPLIAVHLFVFYFGILADDTPPVGLAAFAASAISGGDPIKTGIQGFTYDIRTAILPFIFIFNTELLMIGIDSWWKFAIVVASAVVAMLVFAAATQGYFLVKSRIWETLALLLIAFTLFRPGFWLDIAQPPFDRLEGTRLIEVVGEADDDQMIRLLVEGETMDGDLMSKIVPLPLGPKGEAEARLMDHAGIGIREEDRAARS